MRISVTFFTTALITLVASIASEASAAVSTYTPAQACTPWTSTDAQNMSFSALAGAFANSTSIGATIVCPINVSGGSTLIGTNAFVCDNNSTALFTITACSFDPNNSNNWSCGLNVTSSGNCQTLSVPLGGVNTYFFRILKVILPAKDATNGFSLFQGYSTTI